MLLSLAKIGGQIEKSTMPKWETNLCIAVGFFPRKSTSEILVAVGLDYDSDNGLTKKVISEAHVYIPSEVLFHYGLLQSGLVEFLSE